MDNHFLVLFKTENADRDILNFQHGYFTEKCKQSNNKKMNKFEWSNNW